jgi:hypothetical protein
MNNVTRRLKENGKRRRNRLGGHHPFIGETMAGNEPPKPANLSFSSRLKKQ